VFFVPLSLKEGKEKISKAVNFLLEKTLFYEKIEKNDFVAIKIHFGEEGNRGFVRPEYLREVIKKIKIKGARPFLTDTNTLYVGRRANAVDHLILASEHGFTVENTGAPVIISDGLLGNNEIRVKIEGKHFKEVPIARELGLCQAILSINHFTGHIVTHFGAAIKNLGMGGSARAGKLLQHSNLSPRVNQSKCTGCEICINWCLTNSISMVEGKAKIDPKTCTGCGQCLSVCPVYAITFSWNESSELVQEKMVEHTLGVLKDKKSAHITFLTHITQECDCLAKDEDPVCEDIGVLSSNDIVAIDKAALDLVSEKLGKKISSLPEKQICYAQKLGMGNSQYEIERINL
ncbi:MAG: DUF362 domain-containing protein, partial [Thermoanaerobaculia bacterium]